MAPEAAHGSLPFDEAIRFFRQKRTVPSEHWDDLWQEQHDVAFTVAGATKADLLAELRAAIDEAIAEGTTLEQFRLKFDDIVDRFGWSYRGGRNWRTNVMLGTNIQTSYQAGRYAQLTDPETLKSRPYWEYRHHDAAHPRPLHVSWDGTVLSADDPWWDSHFTPNGWGCHCTVSSVSRGDLAGMGKSGPDAAPDDGNYQWTNPRTGEVHTIPNGIDPGWAYNPGRYHKVSRVLGEKLETLPADLGAQMMRHELAVALPYLTKDFATWADGVMADGYQPRGALRIVGGLSPVTVEHLDHVGHAASSAAIHVDDKALLHMLRDAKQARGQAVPAEILRHLPRVLGKPRAVLWDKADPGLLYVFDAPGQARMGKIVVKVDAMAKAFDAQGKRQSIRLNMVRTSGLVPLRNLQDTTRYEQIEGSL